MMRVRSRVLIDFVLLALVVLLVLLAYFQPGIEKPKPLPVLTSIDPSTVHRIEIDYPGKPPIVLVKEKDQWWVSKPLRVPANRFRAEMLVDLAHAGSLRQYSAARLDLSKFGLAQPRMKVRFDGTEVAFGDTEPINGRRYALTDDTVHLIADQMADLLGGEVTEYVSHALLPEAVHPVEMDLPILAEGADVQKPFRGKIELRFQDSRWVMTPADDKISQDTLNRLVDGWRFAYALEVKEAPKGQPAIGKVTIDLEGQQAPVVFEIVAVQPEATLVRRDLGLEYVVAENTTGRLFRLEPPGRLKK
jgi:Domain of unknown function (DUF4340)